MHNRRSERAASAVDHTNVHICGLNAGELSKRPRKPLHAPRWESETPVTNGNPHMSASLAPAHALRGALLGYLCALAKSSWPLRVNVRRISGDTFCAWTKGILPFVHAQRPGWELVPARPISQLHENRGSVSTSANPSRCPRRCSRRPSCTRRRTPSSRGAGRRCRRCPCRRR